MEVVAQSKMFQLFAAEQSVVEIWADDGYTEGGWSYFWIVDRSVPNIVHNLAYVRIQGGRLERRIYDEAGDDLWVPTE